MGKSYTSNLKLVESGYVMLGSIDEDDDYGIDEHTVLRAPDGSYLLRQASGCSCWDGDYEEETFATLDELLHSLLEETAVDIRRPSLKGAEELIAEVRATLAE